MLSKPNSANVANVLVLGVTKEVKCSKLQPFYNVKNGDEVIAKVKYEGDLPVSAEYKLS